MIAEVFSVPLVRVLRASPIRRHRFELKILEVFKKCMD